MGLRSPGGRIFCHQVEGDLVSAGTDGVLHRHAIGQGVAQTEYLAVIAQEELLAGMPDNSVGHPVGICTAGPAIGLQVVDADGPPRDLFPLDEQVMAVVAQRQAGWRGRICLTQAQQAKKQGSHG